MDSVTCTTCGMLNEAEDNYCWDCGSILPNNNTLESKSLKSPPKSHKTYVLERANFNTAKSVLIWKDNNSVLCYINPESKLMFIIEIIVLTILLIFAMFPMYPMYANKEVNILILYLIIVLILYCYLILFAVNRNMKADVLSENRDLRGSIRSISKLNQLKSVLLFGDWKCWTIDTSLDLEIHFRSLDEGILSFNKDSFTIEVMRYRKDRLHYKGIRKVRAYNKRDNSKIIIRVPDKKIKDRKPPMTLEIKASDSINDLIVVFLVIVITTKFFRIENG